MGVFVVVERSRRRHCLSRMGQGHFRGGQDMIDRATGQDERRRHPGVENEARLDQLTVAEADDLENDGRGPTVLPLPLGLQYEFSDGISRSVFKFGLNPVMSG